MAEKKPASRTKSSSTPPVPKKPSITLEQLQREISERAHEIYEERIASRRGGDELSDWLQAEAEVKKRHKIK